MISSNKLIFILIGFVISILSIIFRPKENFNNVPKKIWTYWDNPDKIPRVVKLCIDSWKKFNPDYEIIVLNKKNFQGFLTIPSNIRTHPHFNDSPARFSDLLRLYALEEYGGIWIDASVLIKKSFDDWLFTRPAEFSGFYMERRTQDKNHPMVESWFLAANKNSTFIKLWKKEFLEMATFKDIQAYLDSRKKMGVNLDKIRDPNYLAIYVAALKVFQIDKYPIDSLILRDSEEGPFKYLNDAEWYSEKALKLACSNKKYQNPIMKMRSDERNILERELDYDLSCKNCGWLD
jgi:hypothetical protein